MCRNSEHSTFGGHKRLFTPPILAEPLVIRSRFHKVSCEMNGNVNCTCKCTKSSNLTHFDKVGLVDNQSIVREQCAASDDCETWKHSAETLQMCDSVDEQEAGDFSVGTMKVKILNEKIWKVKSYLSIGNFRLLISSEEYSTSYAAKIKATFPSTAVQLSNFFRSLYERISIVSHSFLSMP